MIFIPIPPEHSLDILYAFDHTVSSGFIFRSQIIYRRPKRRRYTVNPYLQNFTAGCVLNHLLRICIHIVCADRDAPEVLPLDVIANHIAKAVFLVLIDQIIDSISVALFYRIISSGFIGISKILIIIVSPLPNIVK